MGKQRKTHSIPGGSVITAATANIWSTSELAILPLAALDLPYHALFILPPGPASSGTTRHAEYTDLCVTRCSPAFSPERRENQSRLIKLAHRFTLY